MLVPRLHGGDDIVRRASLEGMHPAARLPVSVVAWPRQPDRPLFRRRARRPGGRQMPAGPGQPCRHRAHVGQHLRRRRPRPGPRVGECRHVPISPVEVDAARFPSAALPPARSFPPGCADCRPACRVAASGAMLRHGCRVTVRALRVLAAGAALAAGRGGCAGGAPVRTLGGRIRGFPGGAGGPGLARCHRPLRPAVGAWLPVPPASRPPPGLGYRRWAWAVGIALGVPTVWITVIAGLLGPIAIAVCAVVLSLPVWIAWGWLARAARKRSG